MCEIPRIRGHDAQLLVGGGFRDTASVAAAMPEEVLAEVNEFLQTEEGQNIATKSNEPDLKEAMNWIGWAEEAQPLEDQQIVLSS